MTSTEETIAVRNQEWPEDLEPLVSIGCLAYNHEKFIREAVESFLNQKTTFKVEILIHDDASEDRTANIIREYESEWPQLFSVIYQKENQYSKGNHPGDLNLRRARGKYIALCEGDDYWTDPLKLQKQVEFLETHPDYSVCVGGYTSYIESEGRAGPTHITSMGTDEADGFSFTLEEMKQIWLTKLLTCLIRRDVLNSLDASLYKYYRDIHFFYHLIKDHKAYYFKVNFGVHRVHPGGVNSMKQGLVNHLAAYNCYKELYEHNRDEYTRYMCLKTTLGFFNYNLYHKYEGNRLRQNLRLYGEAILLVRNLYEAKWLFTAFIKASLKEKLKEVIG